MLQKDENTSKTTKETNYGCICTCGWIIHQNQTLRRKYFATHSFKCSWTVLTTYCSVNAGIAKISFFFLWLLLKIWCNQGHILHYLVLNVLLEYSHFHVLPRFTGSCFVAFGTAASEAMHENTPAMWVSQEIRPAYTGGQFSQSCTFSFLFHFLLIAQCWGRGQSDTFRKKHPLKRTWVLLIKRRPWRPSLHL